MRCYIWTILCWRIWLHETVHQFYRCIADPGGIHSRVAHQQDAHIYLFTGLIITLFQVKDLLMVTEMDIRCLEVGLAVVKHFGRILEVIMIMPPKWIRFLFPLVLADTQFDELVCIWDLVSPWKSWNAWRGLWYPRSLWGMLEFSSEPWIYNGPELIVNEWNVNWEWWQLIWHV